MPALVECTFYGNSSSYSVIWVGTIYQETVIERTIVAFSSSGAALDGWSTDPVVVRCCDLYGNAGGDWVHGFEDDLGVDGNISADPLFCDPGTEDYRLQEGSPCGPDYNPECGLVGAWPVGCGGTPVEQTTWGALKSLFH
jgi:hypothetical protein